MPHFNLDNFQEGVTTFCIKMKSWMLRRLFKAYGLVFAFKKLMKYIFFKKKKNCHENFFSQSSPNILS